VQGGGFLDLPEREAKPRARGLTFAIDGGLPVAEVRALLGDHGAWHDLWKLGWGSAYVDPSVPEKLALLDEHQVLACPGGTLVEVAALQGRAEACIDWAVEAGFTCIEVSDGLSMMDRRTKSDLIHRAARELVVVAEVGAKEAAQSVAPGDWVRAACADLEAGATWVVTEGRESGTVGIYDGDGAVRGAIVDALVEHIGAAPLVFEAPRKDQQAWFVRHLGPDVNLANIAPRDVMAVEALRLGLRADTALAIHLRPAASARA
jgi:phosphosulfolactate synthase